MLEFCKHLVKILVILPMMAVCRSALILLMIYPKTNLSLRSVSFRAIFYDQKLVDHLAWHCHIN